MCEWNPGKVFGARVWRTHQSGYNRYSVEINYSPPGNDAGFYVDDRDFRGEPVEGRRGHRTPVRRRTPFHKQRRMWNTDFGVAIGQPAGSNLNYPAVMEISFPYFFSLTYLFHRVRSRRGGGVCCRPNERMLRAPR